MRRWGKSGRSYRESAEHMRFFYCFVLIFVFKIYPITAIIYNIDAYTKRNGGLECYEA